MITQKEFLKTHIKAITKLDLNSVFDFRDLSLKMKLFIKICVAFILFSSICGFEIGHKCEKSENLRMNVISHPYDCVKFFSCNGTWIEETCPAGQQFEISAGRCKPQILEICPDIKTSLKNVLPALEHQPGEKCFTSSKSGNLYPYPNDCEKYLKCINGYWREQNCPDGLYFSWFYHKCEFPEVAMCSLLETKPSIFYTASKFIRNSPLKLSELEEECPEKVKIHPGDCSRFLECSHGVWEEIKCPRGLGFSEKTLHCEWDVDCRFSIDEIPEPDFNFNEIENPLCQEEFRTHESDCHKFYHCSSGKWHEKICPAGLHFSSKTNRCEWPATADCISKRPEPSCCSVPVRPNPLDCKSFYLCENNNEWILKNCPNDQEFSILTNRCESPEIAGCSVNQDIPTAPTPGPPTPPSFPEKDECSPDGTTYPNAADCSMLKICSGGKLVDLKCPENLLFDIKSKRCVNKSSAHCVAD